MKRRWTAWILTAVFAAGCMQSIPAAETAAASGAHSYRLVISDCSWTEAFREAKEAGGYLARIESREEYQTILQQIYDTGVSGIMFRIGARRDLDSARYCWVDESNQTYGSALNDPAYWTYSEWMSGEPSFQDGDIPEGYVDFYYYQKEGRWVWNDVPDDIISIVPSYSGRLGYIIEFEDAAAAAPLADPSVLLEHVPDEFYFSSGAGGWSTELTLHDDGSFTGSYHDSDMGSDIENYPGGVVYTCDFTGKFKDFTQIDDYTWSMRLDSLAYKYAKEMDWESDGVHYIASDAYGISGGDVFYLYLKGHPVSALPEEYLNWGRMYMGVFGQDELPATLNIYGIYNVAQEDGFGSAGE